MSDQPGDINWEKANKQGPSVTYFECAPVCQVLYLQKSWKNMQISKTTTTIVLVVIPISNLLFWHVHFSNTATSQLLGVSLFIWWCNSTSATWGRELLLRDRNARTRGRLCSIAFSADKSCPHFFKAHVFIPTNFCLSKKKECNFIHSFPKGEKLCAVFAADWVFF